MPPGTPGAGDLQLGGGEKRIQRQDTAKHAAQACRSRCLSLHNLPNVGSSLETFIYIARARKCGAAFTMAGGALTAAMIMSCLAEVWHNFIDVICRGRHLNPLRTTQVIFSCVSCSKQR